MDINEWRRHFVGILVRMTGGGESAVEAEVRDLEGRRNAKEQTAKSGAATDPTVGNQVMQATRDFKLEAELDELYQSELAAKPIGKRIDSLFSALDTEGSGVIDVQQLKAVLGTEHANRIAKEDSNCDKKARARDRELSHVCLGREYDEICASSACDMRRWISTIGGGTLWGFSCV